MAWQTVLLIVLGWFNFRLALLGAAITAGLAWYELKYKGLQSPRHLRLMWPDRVKA